MLTSTVNKKNVRKKNVRKKNVRKHIAGQKSNAIAKRVNNSTIASWGAAKKVAKDQPTGPDEFVAIYRRTTKTETDGDHDYLWRQDKAGDGEEKGKWGGQKVGYEVFLCSPQSLIPEDGSGTLKRAVVEEMAKTGAGGPVSDAGPS